VRVSSHGLIVGLSAVARAARTNPKNPYWARRLLEDLHEEAAVATYRPQVIQAFVTWASHDPSWFVHAIGLTRETFCFGWPKDLLAEVESRFELEDASLKHLILGRLWWAARLRRSEDPEFATRAMAHLEQVGEQLRVGKYYEELGEALAVAAPAKLEGLAERMLSTAPWYNVASIRRTLLEGAARTADWDAYDRHRTAFAELWKGRQGRSLDYCAVLNLDGLAALARGREHELPVILAELAASARNVAFLGVSDTLRLVKTLVLRAEHLVACRDYLRVIDRPNADVLKTLAEIEEQLARKNPGRAKARKRKKKEGKGGSPRKRRRRRRRDR